MYIHTHIQTRIHPSHDHFVVCISYISGNFQLLFIYLLFCSTNSVPSIGVSNTYERKRQLTRYCLWRGLPAIDKLNTVQSMFSIRVAWSLETLTFSFLSFCCFSHYSIFVFLCVLICRRRWFCVLFDVCFGFASTVQISCRSHPNLKVFKVFFGVCFESNVDDLILLQ